MIDPEFLEALARAFHHGAGLKDNQSTTTVGYLNHTLYVTHQDNKKYAEVLLRGKMRLTRSPDGQFSVDTLEPVLTQNQSIRFKPQGPNGEMKKMKKVEPHVWLTEWLQAASKFLTHSKNEDNFKVFAAGIQTVKVVLDQDLFFTKAVETAGLHGESRILRYIVLKLIRNFAKHNMEDNLDANETGEALINELHKRFTTIYGNRLYMGSSQGACTYCADLMRTWQIKFTAEQNLKKDRGDSWLHPVTLTTPNKKFAFPLQPKLQVDVVGKQIKDWREEFKKANTGTADGEPLKIVQKMEEE